MSDQTMSGLSFMAEQDPEGPVARLLRMQSHLASLDEGEDEGGPEQIKLPRIDAPPEKPKTKRDKRLGTAGNVMDVLNVLSQFNQRKRMRKQQRTGRQVNVGPFGPMTIMPKATALPDYKVPPFLAGRLGAQAEKKTADKEREEKNREIEMRELEINSRNRGDYGKETRRRRDRIVDEHMRPRTPKGPSAVAEKIELLKEQPWWNDLTPEEQQERIEGVILGRERAGPMSAKDAADKAYEESFQRRKAWHDANEKYGVAANDDLVKRTIKYVDQLLAHGENDPTAMSGGFGGSLSREDAMEKGYVFYDALVEFSGGLEERGSPFDPEPVPPPPPAPGPGAGAPNMPDLSALFQMQGGAGAPPPGPASVLPSLDQPQDFDPNGDVAQDGMQYKGGLGPGVPGVPEVPGSPGGEMQAAMDEFTNSITEPEAPPILPGQRLQAIAGFKKLLAEPPLKMDGTPYTEQELLEEFFNQFGFNPYDAEQQMPAGIGPQ